MDPLTCVMEKLYESEINCRIESFWDAGWEVRLGDKINGYEAVVDSFYSLDAVAVWLHKQAIEHFPDSDYTKLYKKSPPWVSNTVIRIQDTPENRQVIIGIVEDAMLERMIKDDR